MSKIKKEVITDKYALYNGDCYEVMKTLPPNSIDLSVYSPPFAKETGGLYQYSSDERDLSNCESRDQFMQQYDFMVAEIGRITKPGRITAVHCTDIMNSRTESLFDFPHEIIKLHEKHGFEYKNRITIWKEPMKVRLRTMVKSLMHVSLIEDATSVFPAMPDYLLIFKKSGDCEVPVTHEGGVKEYFGEIPMLPHMIKGESDSDEFLELSTKTFRAYQKKYAHFEGDHKENILSHIIFRRYMSSVWDDVRIDNVLPFKDSKDEDDEKHVHPLQLDVIDRVVALYTNPGEVVLTPFMGVGSEVYSPVSLGRFGIGIELKDSYFKQAIMNVKAAEERFIQNQPLTLDLK